MAATKKKARRRAADVAIRAVTKMPLGELIRFCDQLTKVDQDTAEFVLARLAQALPGSGAQGSGTTDFAPGDGILD